MRILHVINSLAGAGAENLVVTLANEQVKKDPVSIFTFYSEKDLFSDRLGPNIDFYPHQNNNYFSLKKIRHLLKVIKQHDVVHVHLFPPFYIVAFLSFFTKNKKFVYTEHNTSNKRRKLIFKPLEKLVYRQYSKIICISSGTARELKNWMGSTVDIVEINNVIDLKAAENAEPLDRGEIGLVAENKVIAMVGRFQDQKDQDTIVRSLTHLPENFVAIFIGEGEREKEVGKLVLELNLSSRVQFLGIRRDVFRILKASDYGVLSSRWEGFGIAALEYMGAGIVALGTDVAGLNEVIPVTENLFKVGDDIHLAERILNLEKDESLKKEVLIAQESIMKKFNVGNAVKLHNEVYLNS